jgi:hypothetical protein
MSDLILEKLILCKYVIKKEIGFLQEEISDLKLLLKRDRYDRAYYKELIRGKSERVKELVEIVEATDLKLETIVIKGKYVI